MASNKKQAGIERPYNFYEFVKLIKDICKEQGHDLEQEAELEYFSAQEEREGDKWYYREIVDIDWNLVSKTIYGGSEGIYTVFYMDRYDYDKRETVRYRMATAKHCSRADESYMAMHTMAARFELAAKNYISKHDEEFNWRGYDVTGYKDGKKWGGWWCPKEGNADIMTWELLENGADYVTIRNNRTREVTTTNKFIQAMRNQ